MKKRINITLSEQVLACADILAKSKGMNRSEYITYLINTKVDENTSLTSVIADEAAADMRKIFNE